jgi:hypothetical protein
VVGQVGVEGHAVALAQRVALAVRDQCDLARLHHCGLATAGLVHGWVARPAGHRPGFQPVKRDVGPLTGERRRQLLDSVAGSPALSPLAAPNDHDMAVLVQAQQLRERELQAGGDPRGDRERGARLAALNLREHRGAHAAALSQVAK